MNLTDVLSLDLDSFFRYLKTIRYGYMDRSGQLHFADAPDFTVEHYVFSAPEEVVRNGCGWCWDVANLISVYCTHHSMEHVTLFMEYRTPQLHQTHTQVFLKQHNLWYPAPDNSSPEPFGTGADEDFLLCRERFVDTFRAYLKYALKERYDERQLLLNPITAPIPAHISDDEYLKLART